MMLGATVSVRPESPYLLSDVVRLGAAACFAAVAIGLARRDVGTLGTEAFRALLRHETLVVTLLASFVFGVACALSHGMLGPFPHISDEASYWFQAHIFASNRLSVPTPPLVEFFPSEWVIARGGKWFGIFPPGWPLLLSVGMRLGVPSLVNPALGALSLVAIHRLAIALIGREKALLVLVLCALSPFFLIMCASFMSHPASLLFVTSFLVFFLKGTTGDRLTPFALSGLCAGMGFLIRPLDATVLWAAAVGYMALRHRARRQLLGVALSAVGLGAGMIGYVAYNHALTGCWSSALVTLISARNHLGFGRNVGLYGHNLWRAAINLNFNLAVMSADLFGWPISSLTFVFALLSFGRVQWPHRLAIVLLAALVTAYLFYWYDGVCFGARFYFSALPLFLILTVEGMYQAPHLREAPVPLVEARHSNALKTFVALCFGFSLFVYWPIVTRFEPYHNQRGVDSGLGDFVARHHIDSAIVFVGPTVQDFLPGFVGNALDPADGPILYAFESGSDDERLAQRFPDRRVFHYTHEANPRPWPGWLSRLLRRGYIGDLFKNVHPRRFLDGHGFATY
jgi:hypothetical protein